MAAITLWGTFNIPDSQWLFYPPNSIPNHTPIPTKGTS